MGYETRLYVGGLYERYNNDYWFDHKATMELSCMGYHEDANAFYDLFKTELPCKIYAPENPHIVEKTDENGETYTYDSTATDKDCYGETLKYCTPDDVCLWYEQYGKNMDYDLVDIMYGMMLSFRNNKRDACNWIVVFFGY